MGAFAQAASTQRSSALSRLFETLGYTTFQLATFRSTVLASPVYFPFDVGRSLGSQSTMAVAQQHKQTSAGFPIPPACLPGLSADQLTQLNQAEDIFGLPVTSTVSEVHANCTDRPVYGILNILNMRLPFMDNQISLQAAVVTNQVRIATRLSFSCSDILNIGSQGSYDVLVRSHPHTAVLCRRCQHFSSHDGFVRYQYCSRQCSFRLFLPAGRQHQSRKSCY